MNKHILKKVKLFLLKFIATALTHLQRYEDAIEMYDMVLQLSP